MNFSFLFQLLLNNLEPIANYLATLLDKTKANNPVVWLIVVALVMGINYFGQNCNLDFCLNETVQAVIQWVSFFVLALTGSRTSKRVDMIKKEEAKRLPK